MTRIYTTGSENILRSAKVPDNIAETMKEEYNNAIDSIKSDEFELILTKDLDTLKENHDNMKARISKSSISIGYFGHDGWDSVCSLYYKRNDEWYESIEEKDIFFDAPMMITDFSHIHNYKNDEEMAKEEFLNDDGKRWLEWRENNTILS